MGNIYVSPLGGIGNQLRMIVSTKLLADYLKYDHFVVDWVENNRYPGFDSLYKTDDTFKVSSVVPNNAKFVDLTKETIILDEINKFENIIIKGYHYVGANTVLYGLPQEQQNKWFIEYKNGYQKLQLKDDIKLKIPKLPENTIGLQIRRGDNQRSNDNSPTNLFIKKIEQHINSHVFLTTDDIGVENELKNKYPKIITNKKTGYKNNQLIRPDLNKNLVKDDLKNSLIEAIIDVYTLSQCNIIYGSYWSSFGELAAYLNNSKLINIKK